MTTHKAGVFNLICLSIGFSSSFAFAHRVDSWGPPTLKWTSDQIEEVRAFPSGRTQSTEGMKCLAGSSLFFKVRDRYAFDIDETVWLRARVKAPDGAPIIVSYDGPEGMSWGSAGIPLAVGATTSGWQSVNIALPRARFANLGPLGTDFGISARTADDSQPIEFTLCDISLKRTHATPKINATGVASIEITDEGGQTIPARLGLYDSSGRMPLPGKEALLVRHLEGETRVIQLHPAVTWPAKNRQVFYTSGRYHARLPPGEYELLVTKGPEYRLARQRFTLRNNESRSISIQLRRWRDMAAHNWYSGDGHIHYERNRPRSDRELQLFTQAEDLKVSNILQMGNNARTYFAQYKWTPLIADGQESFAWVPGQEDPRTSHRGHAIGLNLMRPVRNMERYLLYHETFEKMHAQGGLVGYAHVVAPPEWPGNLGALRGMALDVPFGLVDFVEVLSGWHAGTSMWFDFLNLGYKLSPSAGTDYPYGSGVPGAVRNYVRIEPPFTPQAWFDALKRGETFVTGGPMLEFSINGQPMGSEIRVRYGEPLVIKAAASINTDIDLLSGIDLIEQGTIARTTSAPNGAEQLWLHQEAPAQRGTWFVIQARGKSSNVMALSAPIYVVVDGQAFWKPAEVPSIVAKLKAAMQEALQPVQTDSTEGWETRELIAQYWEDQRGPLKERVDRANAIYDDLVKRSAASE